MFIYPIYYHDWRNISTVYMYNKTSIKRNILTIEKKIHQEIGRAKDLSAPQYTKQTYTSYTFMFVRMQAGRQQILDRMVADIP